MGANILTTPTSSSGHLWISGSDSWGAIQLSFWEVSPLLHSWCTPAFAHPLLLQCFPAPRPKSLSLPYTLSHDSRFCCSVGGIGAPAEFFPRPCCYFHLVHSCATPPLHCSHTSPSSPSLLFSVMPSSDPWQDRVFAASGHQIWGREGNPCWCCHGEHSAVWF